MRDSQKMQKNLHFWPIWVNFGQKGPLLKFSKNKRAVLGLLANFRKTKRDFPSVKFFQLKTILNQSEEKSKNRII